MALPIRAIWQYIFQKAKKFLFFDLIISLPGIYPKKVNSDSDKDSCHCLIDNSCGRLRAQCPSNPVLISPSALQRLKAKSSRSLIART